MGIYMFNQLRTMAKLPEWDHIWIIEDPIWYDGFFCYQDMNTWQRYSKVAHLPLEKDEMCKYGKIYKVEQVRTWPGTFDYYYKILSERPDEDEEEGR